MNISSIHKEEKWYAVYTHSRAEKKVFEQLVKIGFEAFLPLITTIKQWSDRKKKVEVPLIKSFVFVKTSKKKLIEILELPGVLTILKYLGKPAVVRDVEIENLKIVVSNSEHIKLVESIDLTKGEEIEVVSGPFMGLFATYINAAGKHKVVIQVEALKSFFEVILPLNQLKKVK